MWTAKYKYSWRKMEVAAQNRAEHGEEWSMEYVPLAATMPKGKFKTKRK